jgi:hypothetical protein
MSTTLTSVFFPLGHIYPVQFLFNPMKCRVADFVTGAHGVDLAARRLQGSAPGLDVNG